MEYFVKTEPLDLIEDVHECILCDDGKKYLNLLVQHFQENHKDYNMFEDGPILQYCRCPESHQLQIHIVTHLLSHSILNDYNQNKDEDITTLKEDAERYEEEYLITEAIEDDYDRFEQNEENYSIEEEEDSVPSPIPNKKSRKRKNSSSSSGTKKIKREKNLTCKVCLKDFDNPKRYYNHTAAAHREKFQCDKCELKYNFKYQLKKHIEIAHLDHPRTKVNRPKKFQCDVCSMQFTELRILTEHTNIHLDLRPFVCEFCSEAFHNSANLRYHRKRHLNPNGYKCPVCQESFVNQQSLRKHHVRQHVEIDLDPHRFVCEYPDCGSSFKYEDLLKQHIRKIHFRVLGEFVCEICNFVTNNKQNYFQHRRRLHDIRNRKGNRVFPSTSTSQQPTKVEIEHEIHFTTL
ncbi:hypothetical protein PVAND_005894 [Polypedilum vanderplanki]|uniref:C2H2-type domain-containing protein n=1 Tax=Polypedilum vanderplanki TaxID=319348 RepID=A0A9J6C1X3_POLVA|nr:hypothetical protein PVAND_005894 [Polypedilum vanderplanki]